MSLFKKLGGICLGHRGWPLVSFFHGSLTRKMAFLGTISVGFGDVEYFPELSSKVFYNG